MFDLAGREARPVSLRKHSGVDRKAGPEKQDRVNIFDGNGRRVEFRLQLPPVSEEFGVVDVSFIERLSRFINGRLSDSSVLDILAFFSFAPGHHRHSTAISADRMSSHSSCGVICRPGGTRLDTADQTKGKTIWQRQLF